MSMGEIVPIIGSILTIGLGVFGLLKPKTLGAATGIQPINASGVMELRALFGGVLLVLGLCALIARQPDIYLVTGLAFVGASIVKLISLSVDRPPVSQVLPGILFDLIVGLALSSGFFFLNT
jgi:hypothetical protein